MTILMVDSMQQSKFQPVAGVSTLSVHTLDCFRLFFWFSVRLSRDRSFNVDGADCLSQQHDISMATIRELSIKTNDLDRLSQWEQVRDFRPYHPQILPPTCTQDSAVNPLYIYIKNVLRVCFKLSIQSMSHIDLGTCTKQSVAALKLERVGIKSCKADQISWLLSGSHQSTQHQLEFAFRRSTQQPHRI